MENTFTKEIEDFLSGLNKRSELDILTQLIFRFNLDDKLQTLANESKLKTSVACAISYIDKRPKISFFHPENDRSVEIGDALLIFTKGFIKGETSTPLGVNQGRAMFIQAKKEEKDELKPRNASEKKQFHLYKHWPDFNLFRPKQLGCFNFKDLISFGVNNTSKATCDDCNPGFLLKLSEKTSPVFYQCTNLTMEINIPDFIGRVVSNSIGRNNFSSDQFSQFVNDLYKDSLSNTFIRKSVFGDKPQLRGKRNLFQVGKEGGFVHFPYFLEDARITLNSIRLLSSALIRKSLSLITKFEKRLWVIRLEITYFE